MTIIFVKCYYLDAHKVLERVQIILDKNSLLYFFRQVSSVIKMSHYLDLLHIDKSAFSRFVKYGSDYLVDLNEMELLHNLIIEDMTDKLKNKEIA